MARGRKKIVQAETIKKEPVKVEEKKFSGWTTRVLILKGLLEPYRIPGQIGQEVDIPNDLVDKLVTAKKIKVL